MLGRRLGHTSRQHLPDPLIERLQDWIALIPLQHLPPDADGGFHISLKLDEVGQGAAEHMSRVPIDSFHRFGLHQRERQWAVERQGGGPGST